MNVLQRASFGFLLRHPWQLGLALLGIVVGVAVIVAVDLANASSKKAFLLSMDTLNGRATHQVVGGPAGVDEQLYVELRTRHGQRNVAPVVEGSVTIGDRVVTLLGLDIFAERGFRDFATPAGAGDDAFALLRRLLTLPNSLLVPQRGEGEPVLEIGDLLSLQTAGRRYEARVAGFLDASGSEQVDNLVVADIATAQRWLDHIGRLSRIDVRLENAAQVSRFEALLPPGVQLLPADTRTRQSTELTGAFMTNLTAMSLLAMLIGVFLIYNSTGFTVLQRRALLGTLRALGLTRREAFGLILAEGLVLGLIGTVLGIAAGIWLGGQLLELVARSINDLYFRVTVTDVSTGGLTLAKGAATGLLASLAASSLPAWEASGIAPSLALVRSTLETRSGRMAFWLCGAGVVLVALAVFVLSVSGQSLVAGLAALFMLVLGAALAVPLAVRALTPFVAAVAGRIGGSAARMAVEGIRAALSRTGVAIVALAVAVSATVGVSTMVGSFRLAVSDWVGNTLRADIYVGVEAGSLDEDLVADLVRVDGIAEYSSSRRVWIESPAGRIRVVALDMASESYAGTELVDADADAVWRSFEDEGAVLVSEPFAYRRGVAAGDRLTLMTDYGERDFDVRAVYRSYEADQGAVLMSRRSYDRWWSDDRIGSLGLYLHDGVEAAAVVERLRAVSRGRQALRISSNADLRDVSMAVFDRTFVITDVLYWLAVGVALTGILGAMLALQIERARELGVLRALGMTPAQIAGMVSLQSTTMGVYSGLAAIPLGLIMAEVLIEVINRRAFGWRMDSVIDPAQLWIALLLAGASALAAGVYPAWRAARSVPALAMREE